MKGNSSNTDRPLKSKAARSQQAERPATRQTCLQKPPACFRINHYGGFEPDYSRMFRSNRGETKVYGGIVFNGHSYRIVIDRGIAAELVVKHAIQYKRGERKSHLSPLENPEAVEAMMQAIYAIRNGAVEYKVTDAEEKAAVIKEFCRLARSEGCRPQGFSL